MGANKEEASKIINIPRLIISGDLAVAFKNYLNDNWHNQKGMPSAIIRKALREFLKKEGYI